MPAVQADSTYTPAFLHRHLRADIFDWVQDAGGRVRPNCSPFVRKLVSAGTDLDAQLLGTRGTEGPDSGPPADAPFIRCYAFLLNRSTHLSKGHQALLVLIHAVATAGSVGSSRFRRGKRV